ncbi:MAG: response regulator [Candidatus Omnitrophica bacterium]|nr:response regulator [Candidatus Omnitrophota bacterium]MBU4479571.1 response regulator [Candidatus Omnitrophota bacterium]MCG2704432.1 response regulator [Candidatus Omnitrophota bacterium]
MPEKRKILIIDDEAHFCALVKNNLQASGAFEVITANDGASGIVAARLQRPDLILLDAIMPTMHGMKVAAALKKDPQTTSIPIIFLTAIVTREEVGVEAMRNIGAYNYIAKPVITDDLIKCINKVLSEQAGK